MKLLFTCIGLVLIATSCKTAKETMKASIPLYETRWALKKIYDNGKEENVNTKAFIRFNQEKGSAGGNGSCNSFGSTASVNRNEVSFKNIFSTKMYCDQVQQIENKYLKKLENANRFEIVDSSLVLYRDKEKILVFVAEEVK
jgi:heat shock protein HslJ